MKTHCTAFEKEVQTLFHERVSVTADNGPAEQKALMPKSTSLEQSDRGAQVPQQATSTAELSSNLEEMSLTGVKAKAKAKSSPYGHPLGPHILAPADSKQAETTNNMEADTRGLDNARQTSSAVEVRSFHSAHTPSEVVLQSSQQCSCGLTVAQITLLIIEA